MSFNFTAFHAIKINITINKVSYESDGILDCKFGGLVILQETANVEPDYICETWSPELFPSSYIPQKSSFYTVVHWYEHYTHVEAHLSVQTTTCKIIQLEICLLDICKSKLHWNLCNRYLETTAWTSFVQLFTARFRFRKKYMLYQEECGKGHISCFWGHSVDALTIKLEYETCTLLRIQPRSKFHGGVNQHSCQFKFIAGNREKEFVHHKLIGPDLSSVTFRGQTKEICEYLPKKVCRYNYLVEEPQKLTNNCVANQVISIDAFSPDKERDCTNCYPTLNFNISVNLPTRNWFDIYLSSDQSPYHVNFTTLKEHFLPTFVMKHLLTIFEGFDEYVLQFTALFPQKNSSSAVDRNFAIRFTGNTKYRESLLLTSFPLSFSLATPKRYFKIFSSGQPRTFGIFNEINIYQYRKGNTNFRSQVNISAMIVHWLPDSSSPFSEANLTVETCDQNDSFKCSPGMNKCSYLFSHSHKYFSINHPLYILLKTNLEISTCQRKLLLKDLLRNLSARQILKSWKQASKICKERNGYLPYFTDKLTLKQFMTLVKSTEKFSVTVGIFIGMNIGTTQNSKVMLVLPIFRKIFLVL